MNKKLLMVALDFPPCQSAGVQRTLKFFEHLPELGWDPIVLTVRESVYAKVDSQLSIPSGMESQVYRAWGLHILAHSDH